MKINYYINAIKPKINFGSTDRKSSCDDPCINRGELSHHTYFFRGNFSDNFTDAVINKFPGGIKIYNYACSDGSEPYSTAMTFLQKLGEEKSRKYFPIIAGDLGLDLINQAKNRIININADDEEKIKSKINFAPFNKLFTRLNTVSTFKVQDKLAECVEFEHANIVKDAKEKVFSENGKPCILTFRNAFYHLKPEAKENLLINLYNNPGFPSGSIIYFAEPNDIPAPADLKIPPDKFVQLDKNFEQVELKYTTVTCGGAYYIYRKK